MHRVRLCKVWIGEIVLTKRCNMCYETKTANTLEFGKHTGNKDGLTYACRPCKSMRDKGYNKTPDSRYRYRKYDADRKGRIFTITKEEFIKIVTNPNGCEYCGATHIALSLDRVDNTRGYDRDNVVACCSPCNSSKGDKSLTEWRNKQ